MSEKKLSRKESHKDDKEYATFAGGCFWCMEQPFDELDGVISVTSGYMGGKTANPTYEDVCSGNTGHAEVVQVAFDPKKLSYSKLLEVFWRNIDPTVKDQQFCDIGPQYRTAIFFHNTEQKKQAEASRKKVVSSGNVGGDVMTQLVAASTFYPAEDYHQKYYKKNPLRYKFYRQNSGRDDRLEELWGQGE